MSRRFRDKVVVITGASSGIGLAAARAFARRGATLVLAARRRTALEKAVAACESDGGRALAVPTDVSDEAQVRGLADKALADFGRIDVWLNNAAVTMFSRFEEAPSEDFRRVFDVNFFGYVHGARVALPIFREQGHGVLINNASVVGRMGAPYLSAYVSTKFAILGLTQCLRQEVRDSRHIHVCAVLPASIDTPIFHNAANFTGRAVKPMKPIYGPDKVARAIVRLARRPKPEVIIGSSGRVQRTMQLVAPSVAERMMARRVERDHFQDRPSPRSHGNLMEPRPGWAEETGSWRLAGGRPRALRMTALTLGVAALGGFVLYRSMTPGARLALSLGAKAAAVRGLVHAGRRVLGLLRTPPGRVLVMIAGPAVARSAAPILGKATSRRLAREASRRL